MTPEDKQAWCDALRSGEYHQGRHYLMSRGYWCCLGVACDVFEQEFKPDEDGKLPEGLQKRLGLDGFGTLPKPVEYANNVYYNLVTLNDKAEFTFDQIAKIIEDQF